MAQPAQTPAWSLSGRRPETEVLTVETDLVQEAAAEPGGRTVPQPDRSGTGLCIAYSIAMIP